MCAYTQNTPAYPRKSKQTHKHKHECMHTRKHRRQCILHNHIYSKAARNNNVVYRIGSLQCRKYYHNTRACALILWSRGLASRDINSMVKITIFEIMQHTASFGMRMQLHTHTHITPTYTQTYIHPSNTHTYTDIHLPNT